MGQGRTSTRTGGLAGPHGRGLYESAATLLAGLLVLLGIPFVATAPAAAADDLLQISKGVNKATPKPGEEFSYTITVACSEADCLDARLSDVLPAGLAGFEILNTSFTPAAVAHTVTWSPGATTEPPATVQAGTGVTVDFQQVTDAPAGVGLSAGSDFTVTISLKVPEDYPPGLSADIVNTADATATNALPVSDSATIQIDSPVVIGVAVDKSWTPTTQVFDPGAVSTIGLAARNTSNLPVDLLSVQEPKAAPDGATALDASNPFVVTDFTGFGDVTLPAGCTTVQVDAYTSDGTEWNWTPGNPQAPPVTLPPGVTNADVGGVRITCTGAIAPGARMDVDLGLSLRATDRNDRRGPVHLAANRQQHDDRLRGSPGPDGHRRRHRQLHGPAPDPQR